MKTVSKILFLAVLFVACSSADKGKSPSDFSVAQDVILDTDIGDSLDDLLALDILHHYCRKGRINLLAALHPVALGYTTHDETDMNMCWDATAASEQRAAFEHFGHKDRRDKQLRGQPNLIKIK